MKLFVIMANDFPAGAMDDGDRAEAFCRAKNEADKEQRVKQMRSPIYWKSYEFDLEVIKQ